MNFEKKYPELFQFFAGYFSDADIDGLTDEEVVENYIIDCNKSEKSKSELKQARKEMSSLIDNIENFWQEVSQESNRHFETTSDALEWLYMIKRKLND